MADKKGYSPTGHPEYQTDGGDEGSKTGTKNGRNAFSGIFHRNGIQAPD
jgi:hypothetical protein